MDKLVVFFKLIELAPRFLPRVKPPRIDYSSLHDAIPRPEWPAPPASISVTPRAEPVKAKTALLGEVSQRTSCIPCTRSHLATVSGALGESLRFAREGGIGHPEVQRRLSLAEEEVNILERVDLSPEALESAPPKERELAEEFLPLIREVRQGIGDVASVQDLVNMAARSQALNRNFRIRHLEMKGVDLNPVRELAKKVQSGEMTMEEARAEAEGILPGEENGNE